MYDIKDLERNFNQVKDLEDTSDLEALSDHIRGILFSVSADACDVDTSDLEALHDCITEKFMF